MSTAVWVLIAAIGVACNTTSPATAQRAGKPVTDLGDPNLQAQLTLERYRAENLVLRLSDSLTNNPPEIGTARRLYGEARQRWNVYVDTLVRQLRMGKRADLTPTAQQATEAANSFYEFAESKVSDRSLVGLAPIVADVLLRVGEGLWTFYSDRAEARRNALADQLSQEITWASWDDIVAN